MPILLQDLNVLVTGSGGFVGSHLVRRLNQIGSQVIEFGLEKDEDVRDFKRFGDVGHFDVMVHLAGKTFVPDSYADPYPFYATNLIGTLNALELCRLRNARMVFAGSYVYGVPCYLPIDEKHPVSGVNPYADSKIACEKLCESYSRHLGVNITILRVFNVYGPGQVGKFLIPAIIEQAKEGKIVLKDAKPKRDFLYIDDVVDAYVKAIQYRERGLDVLNIGSGESHSVEQVVNEVLRHFSTEIPVRYTGEERVAEIPDTVANIELAEKTIGWQPKTSFADGIRNCVNLARQV